MKKYNRTKLRRHDHEVKFQPGDTGWRKRDRPAYDAAPPKPRKRPRKRQSSPFLAAYREWLRGQGGG